MPGPPPDGKHDSGAGNAEPGDTEHRDTGQKQHGKRWSQVMEDGAHEKEDMRRNSPDQRRFVPLQQHRTHLLAASRSWLYGTMEIGESTWRYRGDRAFMVQDLKGKRLFTYSAPTGAIDAVNKRILEALQREPRLTMSELGRRIGMSSPAVTERVRRLEETGVIRGYR